MSDRLTKLQRSFLMSRIRSKNTVPEILLRRMLWAAGFRGYRLHFPLPGKPDIVFSKNRKAIFMDGCFWHKCPKCFTMPTTRAKYWAKKIEANVLRDRRNRSAIRREGWQILRIWEHEIKKQPEKVLGKIIAFMEQP